MGKQRRYTPEQIINKLRETLVLINQGKTIGEAARQLGVSERRACKILKQYRSTQHQVSQNRENKEALTAPTIRLASQYGRYDYRRVYDIATHRRLAYQP